MPDFEQIIKGINAVLQLIFGKNVPPWISPLIGWILVMGLILCGLWGILFVVSKIKDLWMQSFLPLFYNADQKQTLIRRQYFAGHIEHEIWRLGLKEEWKDYRFAELEAEVEAEGPHTIFRIFPFLRRTQSGRRREKSLSKALRRSQERLILVEGEPGSGKSIALRHVAQVMAAEAKVSKSTKSIIPLYINLKELERPEGTSIDWKLIEGFVLKSLKKINDRDVDQFLDDKFEEGIKKGYWFFLFDSFDELPEVLSSTEVDTVIKNYGDAIDVFLHRMNQCRGIIASRQFRGPYYFGWPRFRILPLSESRCLQLIRKADFTPNSANEFIGQLGNARQEIRSMASNPLFLNLLCEYVKSGKSFPKNTHVVFENYINNRLTRDKDRLQKRFKLDTTQMRERAEHIAYCMAADSGLGLSPTFENLQIALIRQKVELKGDLNIFLEALAFIKLARYEEVENSSHLRTFTFAHRRFQEYFATCIVLREPFRVSTRQLLMDARWRETAVAMFQTQPTEELTEIVEEAQRLLEGFCNEVEGLIDDPLEYVLTKDQSVTKEVSGTNEQTIRSRFSWPSGSLHLLSLLQDGFISRIMDLPVNIRLTASKLVLTASNLGMLFDRKWALEVSGILSEPVLAYLLKDAFVSQSEWLKEVAYRRAAHLSYISPSIAKGIRSGILGLAAENRLQREKLATKAYLSRIASPNQFLAVMQLLLCLRYIDLFLIFILFIFFSIEIHKSNDVIISTFQVIFVFICLYFSHFTLKFFMELDRSYSVIRSVLPWQAWHASQKVRSSLAIIIVCVYARMVLPVSLTLSIVMPVSFGFFNFSSNINFSHLLLYLIIIFYILLFSPFAIWAVIEGEFIKLRWWIFLPIWPLLYLIIHPIASIKEIYQQICSIKLVNIIIGFISTIVVSIAVGLISLLLYILYIYWFNYIETNFPIIYLIGNIFLISLMILIFCYTLGLAIVYWIFDLYKWRKYYLKYRTVNCNEIYRIVNDFHYAFFRIKFFRTVREKHLLNPTKDAEAFFSSLLIEIESEQTLKEKKGASKKTKPSALWLSKSNNIANLSERDRFISRINPEIIDEINILLEVIRNVR